MLEGQSWIRIRPVFIVTLRHKIEIEAERKIMVRDDTRKLDDYVLFFVYRAWATMAEARYAVHGD